MLQWNVVALEMNTNKANRSWTDGLSVSPPLRLPPTSVQFLLCLLTTKLNFLKSTDWIIIYSLLIGCKCWSKLVALHWLSVDKAGFFFSAFISWCHQSQPCSHICEVAFKCNVALGSHSVKDLCMLTFPAQQLALMRLMWTVGMCCLFSVFSQKNRN